MAASNKPSLNLADFYPDLQQIADLRLREGVEAVFETLWQDSSWSDLAAIPTSGEIEYPNLPHTQCVVQLALAVADAFEKFHQVTIDRDLLVASAILQDASKLVEYELDGAGCVRKTEIGRNYGHGFWAAHLAALQGIRHDVSHVILTHGSQAAKFPDSLEGKILYYVDQLDVIAIHGDRWAKRLVISR